MHHEHPRISGQGRFARIRDPGTAWHSGVLDRRSREGGAPTWRARVGRQGPDSRRRARQSGRCQGRQLHRGGDAGGSPHPGLVAHQTGPKGKVVNRLYIEEGSTIEKELYLSALVDRVTSRVAFVASIAGGMDIEEVARERPEKILAFSIDPATGIMPHHGRRLAQALRLNGELAKQAEGLLAKLYAAFVAKDMSLLEINPLVVTKTGRLVCLDAKISFDDNALFRHADIVALRD